MGKLSQLLRWHKEVVLSDPSGKEVQKVYVRIISDADLEDSYRAARVASAEKRARLRDVDSNDFKDEILAFGEASEQQCKDIINTARSHTWLSQAQSTVVRGELVKISEIAIDPDAPTLEELERLDQENKKVDDQYAKDIEDYIEVKRKELEAELNNLTLNEIRSVAQAELIVLLPLTSFLNELNDQKTWRSVYTDKEFKERGFDSVDDFREMLLPLREQLINAYVELEEGAGDLKN